MIDKALEFILGELNNYLGASYHGPEKAAVLASLSSPDNSVPLAIDNKLVLSLVNIERETAIGSTGFVARQGANGYGRTNPSLYLNLYVLLAASYAGNYSGALRMLSQAMAFFQAKWGFDPQNSAGFPAGMTQLSVEVVSLSMAELSTLWAVLGANYLPSVVYKLRMVTLQEDWLIAPIPAVSSGIADVQGS
ncbi:MULTISPECIES: DUF4255 domain-containing protein [unclassified Janthinobacterium]|uniref:DUF4255 domain-containing protein n=1 Tax=unclassified Janthinobacterium TaxID=2610881 RepID=UPI000883FF7B|nr:MULTISPECIES: DUF4255 domain-containing protein [unclassified Janthinobacterium]SDA57723.1 Protein of unknown function [Janthinobacterium sp. 551a]SFB28929.1 Protein of unknown function [Janthinobacterium sp. 344]